MSIEELTEEEIWREVKGFRHYEISSLGRVRKTSYLRTNLAKSSNYLFVQLFGGDGCGQKNKSGKGKIKKVNVHRLVAEHFLENKEQKKQVNHKDGNKLNNSVGNLEWCTPSENLQHAYDNGLKYGLEGPKSGKRIIQKNEAGEIIRIWNGSREAIAAGYTKAKIYGACGQGHKYKNCYWQYSPDFFDYSTSKIFTIVKNKRIYS